MMESMVSLTEQMVKTEKHRAEMESKSQQRKDESLFKVESTLPEIHADATNAAETIKSLEKFERTLTEARVVTRSVWVRFFREKLRGFAKTWLESALLRQPGLGYHTQALADDESRGLGGGGEQFDGAAAIGTFDGALGAHELHRAGWAHRVHVVCANRAPAHRGV